MDASTFSQLDGLRPIYVRSALEASGFQIRTVQTERMWVPVEIVLGVKPTE